MRKIDPLLLSLLITVIFSLCSFAYGTVSLPKEAQFWVFFGGVIVAAGMVGALLRDWWNTPKRATRKWNNMPSYRIIEAAPLWHGYEPVPEHIYGQVLTADVRRTHVELNDAYAKEAFPGTMKDFLDDDGKPVKFRLIPRHELQKWADARGKRPKFLRA